MLRFGGRQSCEKLAEVTGGRTGELEEKWEHRMIWWMSTLHSPTYSSQNSSGIMDSVWNFQTLGVMYLSL